MRIDSGTTDQYIYFVALLGGARVTGLSSFTVYRSRNGAAAAAMTTPTINETDSTNMPGVYELLLDEDMTIGAGNQTEAMAFHISATGMDDVTREIELFRPPLASGDIDGFTLEEAQKIILAATAGKSSGHESNAPIYRAADDSKDRITATTDANGNRPTITLDAAG